MIRRRDFIKRLIVGIIGAKELVKSEIWTTPTELDLASLADGATCVSKKVDFGAGKMFHMVVDCKFEASPTLGETVDFYLASTPDDELKNTHFLGSLVVDEQDGPTRVAHNLCTFITPYNKYGYLIVDNHSGAELEDWDIGMIELKTKISEGQHYYNPPID